MMGFTGPFRLKTAPIRLKVSHSLLSSSYRLSGAFSFVFSLMLLCWHLFFFTANKTPSYAAIPTRTLYVLFR